MVRILIAVFVVYALWAASDILVHGVLLGQSYVTHVGVFRPVPGVEYADSENIPSPMNTALIHLVVLANAAVFVKIYSWLISPKSILAGIVFGLLWGAGHGVGMGYGTYATMPIPLNMATTWCLGAIVQGVLGGLVMALIVRKRDEPPP